MDALTRLGLTYGGLSDVIGRFRRRLGLPRISVARGTDYLNQEAVPYTYLFSASLLPRPDDWGGHIDIAAGSRPTLGALRLR